MNLPQTPAVFFSLIAIVFLLGVGASGAVYWLIVLPDNQIQIASADAPILPHAEEPPAHEVADTNEVASSIQSSISDVRNLDDLKRIESAFEQGLALRILLADSSEAQTAEFLAQSENMPSNSFRLSLQTAIVQRLAQFNPKRAVAHLRELGSQSYPGRYIPSIFHEWSRSNLDEAIAHARTMSNDWKESALRAIVQERTDLSEEVLLSIARDLGHEQIAVAAITQQKIEDAIGNPEKAWNELVVDMQNDPQQRWSISRVASAWVEQDGLSVLDQISQSLTNAELRQTVVRNVLYEVVRHDPEGAFRYALTLESDPYNSTIKSMMSTWARLDPRSALVAASEVEKSSLRRELEKEAAESWAQKEPRKVLEGINVLPEHAQENAVASAIGRIANNSPKEAAVLVAGMDNGPAKLSAASLVASTWTYQDHEAALDWILNEPAIEALRAQMLRSVMFRLVQIDPQLAMDTALSQPIEKGEGGMWPGMGEVGMELNVITSLAFSDLDKAIELLPQVREGPTKVQAFSMVSGAMIRNGDVDAALNMVQQFSESERAGLYTAIAGAWTAHDPEGMLNSMDRFPSKEVKSKAAAMLVSMNRFQKNLTDEQVEKAKKFLLEEDAEALEKGQEGMIELFRGF